MGNKLRLRPSMIQIGNAEPVELDSLPDERRKEISNLLTIRAMAAIGYYPVKNADKETAETA